VAGCAVAASSALCFDFRYIIIDGTLHQGNAEEQELSIVRYHQVVNSKFDDQVFHEQFGFWLWDPQKGTLIATFTIPRGVAVVAHGIHATPASADEEVVLEVRTDYEAPETGDD
jgi:hypothetical protein